MHSAPRSKIHRPCKSKDNFYIPEPWMEMVTPGKLDRFQAAVFLDVEHIVSQPEYQEHPFTKK